MKNKQHRAFGWCDWCQKLTYADRGTARQVAKLHYTEHKTAYACPEQPNMYHIGELRQSIINGTNTRSECYR